MRTSPCWQAPGWDAPKKAESIGVRMVGRPEAGTNCLQIADPARGHEVSILYGIR
jgi:hypothetical protein